MKRAFPDHQANLVDRREALRGGDFILKGARSFVKSCASLCFWAGHFLHHFRCARALASRSDCKESAELNRASFALRVGAATLLGFDSASCLAQPSITSLWLRDCSRSDLLFVTK